VAEWRKRKTMAEGENIVPTGQYFAKGNAMGGGERHGMRRGKG